MNQELITFNWYDYVLFTTLLGLSTAIGIYFGFFGNKQSSADEYLKGNKKMKVFPISMSLISSHISGIMLLAVPADIYFYGTTYAWTLLNVFAVAVAMPLIYLPVFYKMQLTSIYEYLEARFDARIRKLSSLLFAISSFFYLPIVIYVPAMAFAQATHIPLHLITPLVCAVCLFYTTIGGIKAVVWTDTLQFIVMIGGTVTIMIIGIIDVGGFAEMYAKNKEGGRFDWDMDLTIFKRDTVWASVFGMSLHWMNNICLCQGSVQKFLSLPTIKDVNKTLAIFLTGEFLMKVMCILIGLIIYAKYHNCDPFSIGEIKKHDQLLPYFTMHVGKNIPGLPGLFISAIFCAALSTLSAVMNSLGGTIYEDFVAPFMPKDISQKKVSNILKLIVFLTGIIATSLIFLIEKLGGLLPLAISFKGIIGGALFGVFTIGLLIPQANSKGALSGMVTSLTLMTCLFVPTQWYRLNGYLSYDYKPLNVVGCQQNYTLHFMPKKINEDFEPWKVFKISPFYYTMIGFLLVLAVCMPVSWFTKNNKNEIDSNLISPIAHWLIFKKKEKAINHDSVYYSVDAAIKMLQK